MKNFIFIIIGCVYISTASIGQNTTKQLKSEELKYYLVTQEGVEFNFYHDLSILENSTFYCRNKRGGDDFFKKRFKHTEIKKLVRGKCKFILLPIDNEEKKQKLQEIIAFNDKYILTVYYKLLVKNSNSTGEVGGNILNYIIITPYYYIWDRSFNLVKAIGKDKLTQRYTEQEQLEAVERLFVPFFGDCQEFIDKMKENIMFRTNPITPIQKEFSPNPRATYQSRIVTSTITYYSCNGALPVTDW